MGSRKQQITVGEAEILRWRLRMTGLNRRNTGRVVETFVEEAQDPGAPNKPNVGQGK